MFKIPKINSQERMRTHRTHTMCIDVATETNMAIRKDLLSLGLPLGRSVIGRYVTAKLFEHPMVGNIVAYDKVNNQYTVQWHDCHASREILKEEDVVRFLLI